MRKAIMSFLVLIILTCSSANKYWLQVKDIDTIEAYQEYLLRFPDSRYVQEAQKSIDSLIYSSAKVKNTMQAYKQYLDVYADNARYFKQAQNAIDSLDYAQAKTLNTREAYEAYMNVHGSSANYYNQAQSERDRTWFEWAERNNSSQSYLSYLTNVQNGRFSKIAFQRAEQLAYQELIENPNISRHKQFLENFPKSTHTKEVNKELELLLQEEELENALKEDTAQALLLYLTQDTHEDFRTKAATVLKSKFHKVVFDEEIRLSNDEVRRRFNWNGSSDITALVDSMTGGIAHDTGIFWMNGFMLFGNLEVHGGVGVYSGGVSFKKGTTIYIK